jgi:hypothetical protein
MTFEVYDPYLSETYPVSLLSNKYLMFGTITQTTNTERTSDKIFANDI